MKALLSPAQLKRGLASTLSSVLAIVAGAACGSGGTPSLAGTPGWEGRFNQDLHGGLRVLMASTVGIATVEEARPTGDFRTAGGHAHNLRFDLTRPHPLWPEGLELQDPFKAAEATGFENRPSAFYQCCDLVSGSRLVVFLDDLDDAPDVPGDVSYWVNAIAVVDSEGGLRFRGPEGAALNAELDAISELLAEKNQLTMLESWLAEIASGSRGPVSSAVQRLDTESEPNADWYAIDPADRPLDPELSPPEVRERLREVSVLVEAPLADPANETFLIIRSRSGIGYAGLLGGAMTGGAMIEPDSELSLSIESQPSGGNADGRVAELPSLDSVPGAEGIIVEIGPSSISVRWADSVDLHRLLEKRAASDGAPGPEPEDALG